MVISAVRNWLVSVSSCACTPELFEHVKASFEKTWKGCVCEEMAQWVKCLLLKRGPEYSGVGTCLCDPRRVGGCQRLREWKQVDPGSGFSEPV